MTRPASKRLAKELVESISESHGYIGEDTLGRMDPSMRRKVEEALLRKDELIGDSVITLAKNLYTSKARFVFELIQNCDDNRYTKAAAREEIPYVAFKVYPDHIVVECNEDGFTNENLKAICSVGKSSKKGAQGYIGEKGIGFKSVFMAAWKVHIQSGKLSFSFKHKEHDSGMGMISPEWEDTQEQLEAPLTRITLHLHDAGNIGDRAREAIKEQFEELEETFLLFTRNIRQIQVSSYAADGTRQSETKYAIEKFDDGDAILRRSKTLGGQFEQRKKYFHVITHQATNLAKNENRTYSELEDKSRAYSRAEVVLAFPLTETSHPIIEPQDLFAFLPVREVGFYFLIQTDFVTDANRQDIVRDSIRNTGLLDGVAKAFVKAIKRMCQRDTLRYTWMRFLPDKNATHWGHLWSMLIDKIADRLSDAPVIYGRRDLGAHRLSDLYRLPPEYMDKNGEPLFENEGLEQIISNHYAAADLDLLASYGLRMAGFASMFVWLLADLESPRSRMKSISTCDTWHTQVAKLLQQPFVKKMTQQMSLLGTVNLLPLQDGSWTNVSSGQVYFAKVDGLQIPPDIDLRLIDSKITNPDRITLFEYLGVEEATHRNVQERIHSLYKSKTRSTITIAASKQHLHFLYLTDTLGLALNHPKRWCKGILVHASNGKLYDSRKTAVYIASDQPYGPRELFRNTAPGPYAGDGAPGYQNAIYLHEDYFIGSPVLAAHKQPWAGWLVEKLHVRDHVSCLAPDLRELGKEGKYLQEHRPERFVGSLLRDFNRCKNFEEHLWYELRRTSVLCLGKEMFNFRDCYFPTQRLVGLVKRFVHPTASFPWLDIGSAKTPQAIPEDWTAMLTHLGLGIPSSDLDFALDMLRYTIYGLPAVVSSRDRTRLFDLYDHIHSKYREAESHSAALKKIREVFNESKRIYIPLSPISNTWAAPSECVWDAAQQLETYWVLGLLYEPLFAHDHVDRKLAPVFFGDILGIPQACSWEMYVEELKELKAQHCDDSDFVTGIYKALDAFRPGMLSISQTQIRSEFEDNALIYAPSGDGTSWRRTSECVWSHAARLKCKVSLNDDYEELKELFVDLLEVKLVDLAMAVEELEDAGSRKSASAEDLKDAIMTVNSLLPLEDDHPSPDVALKSRIFPVRQANGQIKKSSIRINFFLVDREPFKAAFEGKVKFLDFELDEIRQLRPFIEWASLGDKLLSTCVKEITSFHGEKARLLSSPDRQVRNRAHSLVRIAAHHNSPRTKSPAGLEALYGVLRNAEIHQTDGISSDLSLQQDGKYHVIEGKRATLHIDGSQTSLKIYLPRRKSDQGRVFASILPEKLFEWMMTSQDTLQIPERMEKGGVMATMSALVVPRSTLLITLEDLGIATIDLPNLDDNADELETSEPETESSLTRDLVDLGGVADSAPDDEWDSSTAVCETPTSSVVSPSPNIAAVAITSAFRAVAPARPRKVTREPDLPPVPRRSASQVGAAPIADSARRYITLLDKVITAGRNASIPSVGAFDMSRLLDNLPSINAPNEGELPTDLGVRSQAQIERDCKVGAAGELFVFELLSNLEPQLPGFSRANWQSTMRKYVTAHHEYADMESWEGWEKSDIMYRDVQGTLTEAFIDKGYLDESWRGKRPECFVEVKTTTSACETPFYVSKAQYQRMKGCALAAPDHKCVYVIFRVFKLGRSDMGLQIYFNPMKLKEDGLLKFREELWSAVPVTESR